MKKYFLFAIAAMTALVGCKEQTQSEVDFADVKLNATISGQVVYFADQAGAATEEMAMEGVRVYFQVATSAYADGAKGNKQFAAVTDAEGKFSITVPTGAKVIEGNLLTDMFKAEQAGKVIWLQENKEYSGLTLNAGDNKVYKLKLQKDAVLSECIGEGTVKGVLTYDAGVVAKSDGTIEGKTNAFAANVNVKAVVDYAWGGETLKKTFMCKTNDKGEYAFSIPTQDGGNEMTLSVEQFTANYTEFKNNTWTTKECFYKMSAEQPAKAVAAEVSIKDLRADQKDEIITPEKTQVKFNVNGKLKKQVEEGVYVSDVLTGYTLGSTGCEYSFTVRLDLWNDASTEVISTIIYEGNKVNDDKKGDFSVPVQVYDDWNLAKVQVRVYLDRTEKVENAYKHKYYTAEDAKLGKWPTKAEDMDTQNISGIYKGGDANDLLTSTYATDKQLFFDLEVGTLTAQFEPENTDLIRGNGNPDVDKDSDGYTQYKADVIY